jgi:hypothetical protein
VEQYGIYSGVGGRPERGLDDELLGMAQGPGLRVYHGPPCSVAESAALHAVSWRSTVFAGRSSDQPTFRSAVPAIRRGRRPAGSL